MQASVWQRVRWLLCAACTACGAPAPPPTPPEPAAPEAATDPSPPAEPDQESEPADGVPPPEPQAEPVAPEPAAEEEPDPISKPSKPASELITQADTDFLLDDTASELKAALKGQCEAKHEEAAEVSECLSKAREEFGADVLSFRAAGNGSVRLTIYRRKASKLAEVYSASVVLKDDSETTVTVNPKGAKGQRPIFKGQGPFSVVVPDDYHLVLQDPKWGKLSYRAKYGLVAR